MEWRKGKTTTHYTYHMYKYTKHYTVWTKNISGVINIICTRI
jgi:hypothetical protein